MLGKLMKVLFNLMLIFFVLVFCGAVLAQAEEAIIASGSCGTKVGWQLNSEGTLTISGEGDMTGYSYDTQIPWKNYLGDIKTAVIEEGVTSVSSYAFYNCSALTSVTIPEGVTSVGSYAFYNCSALTAITIPEGVTTIKSCTFQGCSSLSDISIPYGITSISSYAFSNCSNLTSLTLPDSVSRIFNYAFHNCSKLSITIPDNISSIDSTAFAGADSAVIYCSAGSSAAGLLSTNKSFVDPDHPDFKLRQITNDDDTLRITIYKYIGKGTSATIPAVVRSIPVTTIGASAFNGCGALTEIIIPEGITTIDSFAFSDCSGLTDIVIPDGITSIDSRAFSGCSAVLYCNAGTVSAYQLSKGESFVDPDYLGFELKQRLNADDSYSITIYRYTGTETSVTVPGVIRSVPVTTIQDYVFFDRNDLISVTIPFGVTTIRDYAFRNCSSLTRVDIPEGVTTIEEYAFYDCKNVTLYCNAGTVSAAQISNKKYTPSNVYLFVDPDCPDFKIEQITNEDGSYSIAIWKYIGIGASAEIPAEIRSVPVSSISSRVFVDCSTLIEIIIPDNILSIASNAFDGCYSVPVYCNAGTISATQISNSRSFIDPDYPEFELKQTDNGDSCSITIWEYIGAGSSAIIPENMEGCPVTIISASAFYGCAELKTLTIPRSVTRIGDQAFGNCVQLTTNVYSGSEGHVYCENKGIPYILIDSASTPDPTVTPTVEPTVAPPPIGDVSVSLDKTSIDVGETVTATWAHTDNVSEGSIYFAQVTASYPDGTHEVLWANSDMSVETYTFIGERPATLTFSVNTLNSASSKTLTVNGNGIAVGAPEIAIFANKSRVSVGEEVTASWTLNNFVKPYQSYYARAEMILDSGHNLVWETMDPSVSSYTYIPTYGGTLKFFVSVIDANGVSRNRALTVPVNPGINGYPYITSLTAVADKSTINAGEQLTLFWDPAPADYYVSYRVSIYTYSAVTRTRKCLWRSIDPSVDSHSFTVPADADRLIFSWNLHGVDGTQQSSEQGFAVQGAQPDNGGGISPDPISVSFESNRKGVKLGETITVNWKIENAIEPYYVYEVGAAKNVANGTETLIRHIADPSVSSISVIAEDAYCYRFFINFYDALGRSYYKNFIVKVCSHNSIQDIETYFVADNPVIYENLMDTTHDVKGVEWMAVCCANCKEPIPDRNYIVNANALETNRHNFENGICTDCGFLRQIDPDSCDHEYDYDSCVCLNCGETVHNGLEYMYCMESVTVQNSNADSHTVSGDYVLYGNCWWCNTEKATREVLDQRTMTQGHTDYWDTGICSTCNYQVLDFDCTNGHDILGGCWCQTCYQEFHSFVDCICEKCGYTEHSFLGENCVCTVCGTVQHQYDDWQNCVCSRCEQAVHSVREDADVIYENAQYIKIDDWYHSVTGVAKLVYRCQNCDTIINVEKVLGDVKQEIRPHTGDHCECGYVWVDPYDCTHDQGSHTEERLIDVNSGLMPYCVTAVTHTYLKNRVETTVCNLCGEELSSVILERNVEITSPHDNWEIGEPYNECCYRCGYTISCSHNNLENIVRTTKGGIYTTLNSQNHKLTGIIEIAPRCKDCGMWIVDEDDRVWWNELFLYRELELPHTFKDGVCTACNYKADMRTPGEDAWVLPAQLTTIQEEAFFNLGMKEVVISDKVSSIGSHAFAACENLQYIFIPDSVTDIAANAFEGCTNLVFVCASENAAAGYARNNNIEYIIGYSN